jgi:hypothetical protein
MRKLREENMSAGKSLTQSLHTVFTHCITSMLAIAQEQQAAFEGLAAKVAGMVDTRELRDCCEKLAVPSDSTRSARFVQFAMLAADEALNVGHSFTACIHCH